ncbi:MAG: DUF4114 domain-containing protein [Pseudomonadota bacterium]|nr:DUF4114 domain-containing protein [Pseudomonadota bacterium]
MPEVYDYTVNTLDDFSDDGNSNTWSLREAIEAANALGGAQTIGFDPGLSGTITLSLGQLDVTDSLSINGGGAITIDGDAASRVMRVLGDADDQFTFENITLTNGSDFTGGGLYIGAVQSVALNNVTISDSVGSGNGGGIFVRGTPSATSLTITDSTISGNSTAANGGGIFAVLGASVSLFGTTTVENNTAAISGGGIAAVGDGTGVLLSGTSVSVETNAAGASGGGIYLDDASLVITGSNIGFNSAGTTTGSTPTTANPGNGGGIYARGDSGVAMNGGYVVGNHADADGGGFWIGAGSGVYAQGQVFGNSTLSNGAGFFVEAGGNLTANSVGFASGAVNVAVGEGDAIYGADGTASDPATQRILLLNSTFPSQDIVGGPGNDVFHADTNANEFTTGGGWDWIFGSTSELDQGVIHDFSVRDRIIIDDGDLLGVDVDFDTNQIRTEMVLDGAFTFTFADDYTNGTFLWRPSEDDIEVAYMDSVGEFSEKVAIADTSEQVGPGLEIFYALAADGDLRLINSALAVTSKQNTVGYYTYNFATGQISDVRILAVDGQIGATENVADPADGNVILPFIVSDGFEFFENWSSGTLTFDDDGKLLVDGQDEDLITFHTMAHLNPDGLNHARIGFESSPFGGNVVFAFEDIYGLGDRDFQDVIVAAVIDLDPIAAS